ncbi:basic proline-rich protein-like [Prionailurus bengalensis]|uniref:basic proline-rich protein-like n=1 Tax=Prionailurus bengalensis TaxID=37029 RepID=UPI001CA9148F|nr:basic proline-rich protein-like [Prionailurus bengalensis]
MTSFPAATPRPARTPPTGAAGPRGPPPGAGAPGPRPGGGPRGAPSPPPLRASGPSYAGGGRGRSRPEASAAQSSAAPPRGARGPPREPPPRPPPPPTGTPPVAPSPRLKDHTGSATTQHQDAEATGAPPPRSLYIDAGPPGARRLFQKPPEPSGRTLPNRRRGRAPAPAPWPRPRPSPGRARARPERSTPNGRRARPRARLRAPAQPGILAKVWRLPGLPPPALPPAGAPAPSTPGVRRELGARGRSGATQARDRGGNVQGARGTKPAPAQAFKTRAPGCPAHAASRPLAALPETHILPISAPDLGALGPGMLAAGPPLPP